MISNCLDLISKPSKKRDSFIEEIYIGFYNRRLYGA